MSPGDSMNCSNCGTDIGYESIAGITTKMEPMEFCCAGCAEEWMDRADTIRLSIEDATLAKTALLLWKDSPTNRNYRPSFPDTIESVIERIRNKFRRKMK